jgi:glycosyltransferase involved in cell wall biosynthesis
MTTPEMTMFRVRSEQIGYGRLGVYLAAEMKKQGIKIYDEIDKAPHNFVLDNPEAYKAFGPKKPEAGITNIVLWISVPSHARGWWSNQTPIMFTMWETSHLPSAFRENLHEFDTLIVPSKQNLELFSKYHHNVKYVPLGVDPERWYYIPRKMPTTRFNFLIGGRGQRKGTDLAYKAFRKCFPEGSWGSDQPAPYLIMKSPRYEDYYGDRIETLNGYLSSQDEIDLYASAHCYLGPSRGEGFGLQPLQAIVQGLPTILTDAHGHESFAKLGMAISAKMDEAGYFVFGSAGDWWEPDFDELCDTMLWTYNNYQEAVDRARYNAPLAAEFTWEKCANGVLDAIGRERLVTCDNPGEWHEPVGKLFKVVLVKDTIVDIGGNIMALLKGKEYRVPADVKRILFDGKVVDIELSGQPQYITEGGTAVWDAEDEGLLPSQLAEIPELLERQSYCPTCYQKYGTGEKYLDKILERPWDTGTP